MSSFDLADFYRRRLRRYRVVKATKDAVWPPLMFLLRRLPRMVARTVVRPVARAILPPSWLRNYQRVMGGGLAAIWARVRLDPEPLIPQSAAAQSGARVGMMELVAACSVQVEQPAAWPEKFGDRVPPLAGAYAFPAIVLSEFKDAEVTGGSNLVAAGGAVIHHDLFRPSHDFTSEELHGRIHIEPLRSCVWRFRRSSAVREFDQAALFTDACATNYAHWLTEVLPRVHAYAKSAPPAGSVALFDAGLHRNLVHSAELMLPEGVRSIQLEPGTSARVGALQVVSAAGYIPFDRRPGAKEGHSHGLFSGSALRSMREHLASRIGPGNGEQPRRLLLRRNSTYRALKNEQELEERLAPHGFVVVYPERLDFVEQFQLFSGAEMVVGATGAAFANLIFCPPQTHIVICLSAHREHSFGYWQGMAAAVGNRISYVLGPVAGARGAGVHADYRIDVADVLQAIGVR